MLDVSPINPAKLQKQLEQKAMQEKKNREEAIANIQKIMKLIEEARNAGMDVSGFQEGLKSVQAHMRSREFSEAASSSREVVDSIHSSVKTVLEEKKSEFSALIEKAESLGVDVSSAKEVMKSVAAHEEKGDFLIALKEVTDGSSAMASSLSSTASSVVDETERLIDALEGTVDVSEPRKLIADARKKIEEGDTDAALSLCEKARDMVKSASESAAESLLADAEINITILERLGSDVTSLRKDLKASEKKEGSARIAGIMDVGRQARDAVKSALAARIEEMSSEIETIKELGGDPSEIESLLKKASDNIEKNNLALSAETLEKAGKKAEETKFNIVVMAMNPAFSKMKAASKIGADISVPEKKLLDARNALKMGEYTRAMELSAECEQILDEILDAYKKTSELLPKLDKLFKEADRMKADTTEAKKLLVGVKSALNSRDFVKAYELAVKTRDALESGKEAGVKQAMNEGKRLIQMGEELGLDMAGEEVAFQEAEKALKAKDHVKARKFADVGLKDVKEKIRNHIDIRFDEMESDMEAVKGSMDIKEARKLLSKGRKYLEFGDFTSAIQTMREVEELVSVSQKEMAARAVEHAKEMVQKLMEDGIQDSALEDSVADMLAMNREGRYAEAIEAAGRVEQEINNLSKTAAQQAYNEAKQKLAQTKPMQGKIDLKRFHDRLLEARAEFKRGNYINSMNISHEMSSDLEKFISEYDAALSAFNLAQDAIKDARKKGINVTEQAKRIFKAREMMKKGDFDAATKISEEITQSLSGAAAKQDLETRVKMIEARLFSARTLGIELKDVESMMERIKALSSEGKNDEAMKIMDDAEERVESAFRDAIEKKISIAETLINDARDIGINVGKAEESIVVARDALEKGDYIDAYRYADDAQKVIDEIKSVSKKVAEKITAAHNKINEAESLRADVRNARVILDRAIEALKDNRTKEAMELADKCISMVDEAERKKVELVIGDFVRIIDKSKKTGMDTSLAENLIHQARNALDDGKYQKALSLAMQSEVEMEKVELQKDIAEKAIKTLNEKIEDVRKRGISVEEVLTMLNRAEGAYDAGAYIKSFEYTMNAGEKLQEIREMYESLNSDLSELEMRLKDARENHIDVVRASELYVSAKSALEQGRIEEARKTIKEALKALDEVFIGHVDEIIDYADAKIKYAKKMGANVSEAETAIKEAKKIRDKDPAKALRLANGSRAMIERSGIDTSFVDRAYSINFEIARAKRFGVDVKAEEKLLKGAIESIDSDSERADELLKQADEGVKRALGRLMPSIELKIDADTLEKDVWKDATVRVSNTGNAPARDIKFDVDGDIEIEGLNTLEELDKGSSSEIAVKIMAQKEGEIPVKAKVSARRLFDGKEFEFEQETSLRTREKPRESPGAKQVDATEPSKCGFCNGTIKPGMKMVVCGGCGATYHVPCAKRIGNCKVCGASLEPKKPKAARKKLAIKLG